MPKSFYASIGQQLTRNKVISTGYGRSARGGRYVMDFVEVECDPKDKISVRKAKEAGINQLFKNISDTG